jgi:hypothetical protein
MAEAATPNQDAASTPTATRNMTLREHTKEQRDKSMTIVLKLCLSPTRRPRLRIIQGMYPNVSNYDAEEAQAKE